MERLSHYICEIAMLVSGYIYIYTIGAREHAKKRILCNIAVFMAFFTIVNNLPMAENIWLRIVIRMIAFAYLIYFLYSGWEVKLNEAVYYGVWAFMSWQLLYETWMLYRETAEILWGYDLQSGLLIEIVVFCVGYLMIAFTIGKWMPDAGKKRIGPKQFGLAILILVLFQVIALIMEDGRLQAREGRWSFLYLFQVLLAITLYLQNELFKKDDIRQELEVMNLLWEKEQEQYRLSKENIALINQKCHDLKHQIRALRNCSREELDSYLKEIEASVEIYESIVKTGNEVLDVILTEKSLYCKERDITVSCVADGSLLDFINKVDLYAIMGNALDNAIEAVEKFQQKEKRQIDIMIFRQQQFLAIHVINPIQGDLLYEEEEELPATTKKDKAYHGFGLRSMKYMLKKYDGVLSISDEDGCFSLMMLIPIP